MLKTLRRIGRWCEATGTPARVVNAQVAQTQEAIRVGFRASGLPHHSADNLQFDLLETGKFHEVAFYAGKELGIRLRTVGDLFGLLLQAHAKR